jgi:hypothetical protein
MVSLQFGSSLVMYYANKYIWRCFPGGTRGHAIRPLFSPLTHTKYIQTWGNSVSHFPLTGLTQERHSTMPQLRRCDVYVYIYNTICRHACALYTSSVQLGYMSRHVMTTIFILMNLLSSSACGATQWHQRTRHAQSVMGRAITKGLKQGGRCGNVFC